MTTLQRRSRNRLYLLSAFWAAFAMLAGVAFWWSEFDLEVLASSGPRFAEFFSRLTPPDWSVTGLVLRSTIETLMIALAGTTIAVLISLPIGFLAATNVSPVWIAAPLTPLPGAIRSIPLIVVAVVFVAAVG